MQGRTIEQDIEAVGQIPVINSLLEVICRTTGMGFAAIARVTDTRWVVCSVKDDINFGLKPGGELVLETTICHEIRQNGGAVVIDHVDLDPHFARHHTPLQYGFQSYISMPIVLKDGSFFGTLCAIDPKPNKLNTAQTIGLFTLFADLISYHLNTIDQLAQTEAKLLEERQTAELREQFIAILGHDLRNPISAVSNVAQLLLRMPLDQRTTRLANILKDASFRMKGLIDNVMDFASGRMGGGISLNLADKHIETTIKQVITQISIIWPQSPIETTLAITQPVTHDARRIAQLLANLLTNAITHGQKNAPVKISAISQNGQLALSVSNSGAPISSEVIQGLFQPFSRGAVRQGQQGLGLGLYIAWQIATAHGGVLTVASGVEQTTFTFTMPVQ
ncbi:hypothetical protein BDD43_5109 [Mucilaginibacter gracilis]|uniref:histidine kinase n=1 Tax=Mucilaginibacter gracilis TaxID=423350 RepID=A0A495J780_9SPHI|nr:GAF domain-containing sensor histidine kinase [Mucilaginibacter gracilis]RKR84856.1 hypothetical protein BDD43_5109 [Mucilaginibacter gracilis]